MGGAKKKQQKAGMTSYLALTQNPAWAAFAAANPLLTKTPGVAKHWGDWFENVMPAFNAYLGSQQPSPTLGGDLKRTKPVTGPPGSIALPRGRRRFPLDQAEYMGSVDGAQYQGTKTILGT